MFYVVIILVLVCFIFVFFFKQKTAYEMRISDWSSDVCSSDLLVISISEKFGMLAKPQPTGELYAINADGSDGEILVGQRVAGFSTGTRLNSKRTEPIPAFMVDDLRDADTGLVIAAGPFPDRQKARSVGNEWVRTCRARGCPEQ